MANNIPMLVALILLGVAILIHIVAIATKGWVEFRGSFYGKLFPDGPKTDALKATEAMMLLGLFAFIGSLVCGVIHYLKPLQGIPLGIISGALAIAGAVFTIIGVIIYGAEIIDKSVYDPGYSFILAILSAILGAIAGVIILLKHSSGVGAA